MFFDSNSNPRIVPNSRGKKRHPKSKDLMTAVKCSDPLFIDFLQNCLAWDPKERYKPEDALQHAWILEATNPAPRRSPLTLLTTATKGDLQRSKRKPAAKDGSKSAREPAQGGGGAQKGTTPRAVGDANSLFPPINLEGGGGGPRRKKFHVLPAAGQQQGTSGKSGMITIDGTLRKVCNATRHTPHTPHTPHAARHAAQHNAATHTCALDITRNALCRVFCSDDGCSCCCACRLCRSRADGEAPTRCRPSCHVPRD